MSDLSHQSAIEFLYTLVFVVLIRRWSYSAVLADHLEKSLLFFLYSFLTSSVFITYTPMWIPQNSNQLSRRLFGY